jgi:hypothetical protein
MHQVGAFEAIMTKSSTDFDDIIFPPGSVFVFGSWVYKTDEKENLQGRFVETQEDHGEFILSTGLGDLAERLSKLTMSESTQAPSTTRFDSKSGLESSSENNPGSLHDRLSSFLMGLQKAASILQRISTDLFQGSIMKPGPFPMGLNDMARSYQAQFQEEVRPVRRLLLPGGSRGSRDDYNP